ncbi:MAG: putative aminohydrolase SsnA [Chloroflexi bacterium]|nr:putative aminohydrolase SsnA [Chloroflexota bacterium]
MLITNGTLITLEAPNRLIAGGALYIEGDHIADVGTTAELVARYPTAKRLDAGGKLVLPANVCAHTHFYGAFARGLALSGPPPANFLEILQKLWWRLDRALTWEDIRYSTLVCLVEAIRHGTTTLFDHHASPGAIDGSLDIIAEAVQQAGLRACLCYEVTDRNGEDGMHAGIRENRRFIEKTRREGSEQLAGTFGLHASLTLSDKSLRFCREAAGALDVGFHIHVAEAKADQKDSLKKSGQRVVERLEDEGILGPRTIAAHCVHVDAYEMDTLRSTHTKVTHQPRSNMNNAVGTAPVESLLKRHVTVGLGNDGFSNDMFQEMKAAYLVQKLARQDPRALPADQVVQMAYANNAEVAGPFFLRALGRLATGAYADVILLDYVPPTPLTAENFPWHVIFGLDGSYVTHTICAGQLLMEDRRLLTLDEEAIAAKARERARIVWGRV